MDKKEFSRIRHHLGKTQKQLAQLLGTSLKAVQSFEQGWRNMPVHIERHLLFFVVLKHTRDKKLEPCWTVRQCSDEMKHNCPAWEFQSGMLCWFINGTICNGTVQQSWQEKMKICRQCEVLLSCLSSIQETGPQ